jgi:hypothetical protein
MELWFHIWCGIMSVDKKRKKLTSVNRLNSKHTSMGHQKRKMEGCRNSIGRIKITVAEWTCSEKT